MLRALNKGLELTLCSPFDCGETHLPMEEIQETEGRWLVDGSGRSTWCYYFNYGFANVDQVFLTALFASQIGANMYGSGLHMQNVKKIWRRWHWRVRSHESLRWTTAHKNSSPSASLRIISSSLVSNYLFASVSFKYVCLSGYHSIDPTNRNFSNI